MKKIIAMILALSLTAVLSISSFAAGETVDPQTAIETKIAVDTTKEAAIAVSEVKDDLVQKSDVKSFKGKFAGLLADLNILRTECKSLWSQIGTTNQSIKSAWANLKASLKGKDKAEVKKILTGINTAIEPLRTRVTALHTDIKAIRAQKAIEWTKKSISSQ